MKVPSYLRRALEPWTERAGQVQLDVELEILRREVSRLIARSAGGEAAMGAAPSAGSVAGRMQAGPSRAEPLGSRSSSSREGEEDAYLERKEGFEAVTGEAQASSVETYDRGAGLGAYAVRAGALRPDDAAEDELLSVGALTDEERMAAAEALEAYERGRSERGVVERATWRGAQAKRYRDRVSASGNDFANREELTVARMYDDMYRRHRDDIEFELMMRKDRCG